MSYDPLHLVNVESECYLKVNNCSMQIRKDGFTVMRKDGWRDWQLLLIVSGRCIVYHNGKEYSLSSGGVILYAPGEMQKYIFPDECQSLWMHFSGTAVREIMDNCALASGVYQLKPDLRLTEQFYTLIERFNHESTEKYTNASVIELLCIVSDKINNCDRYICPSGIRKVTEHLSKNYAKPCSIAELSDISGYSKSRFSFLFKLYTGKTAVEYQRSLRLNAARDLLSSTELSVGEISACCGYDDALYFSRIFRKEFGISPLYYRRDMLGQDKLTCGSQSPAKE